MKTYEVVDVYIHVFLISALVGGEWLASRSCRFTPRERAHGIYFLNMTQRSEHDAIREYEWLGGKTV
jgi:hypothetical protein